MLYIFSLKKGIWDRFESLFGMSTGYILDFSNREFQEFIYSIMNIYIYNKYEGMSKAKIL